MLDYEKLDVYQAAIEFSALVVIILKQIPKGNAQLVDQLKRSSLSIPLNIAEGVGKTSLADKKRYYSIARGSGMESGAILDVCKLLKVIDSHKHQKAKNLLVRIVGMLSKMCGV